VKAFTYAQNQWVNLMTLFEDGRLLIDNNLIENKIRPLALGRKNYLICRKPSGRTAGSHDLLLRGHLPNAQPQSHDLADRHPLAFAEHQNVRLAQMPAQLPLESPKAKEKVVGTGLVGRLPFK
jgi:hypothetical protein